MWIYILITFVAAILGGTLNGVAGGGTFLTLPSLIWAGVLPVEANATSTTALWPGSAAAIWALRKELLHQNKTLLLVLGMTGFVGGAIGALLLIVTPQSTFVLLIPYLLLLATVLFAISPRISASMKKRAAARQKERLTVEGTGASSRPSWRGLSLIAALELLIAIYGGYFGGGLGILTLAVLGLIGMEDLNEMNAVKNTLVVCINGVAIILFIVFGVIIWFNALIMIVGAIIGGYGGVYFARKLDQRIVRSFVLLVGVVMTVYFFYKYGFF
ncbi:MAG TPA: sulfite exporter TauE/SafE family protein [Ktedonobacteraceae bacterium]